MIKNASSTAGKLLLDSERQQAMVKNETSVKRNNKRKAKDKKKESKKTAKLQQKESLNVENLQNQIQLIKIDNLTFTKQSNSSGSAIQKKHLREDSRNLTPSTLIKVPEISNDKAHAHMQNSSNNRRIGRKDDP